MKGLVLVYVVVVIFYSLILLIQTNTIKNEIFVIDEKGALIYIFFLSEIGMGILFFTLPVLFYFEMRDLQFQSEIV